MNKRLKSVVPLLRIILFGPAVLLAQMLEAPELPSDNLIANPWFRDANDTKGSYDGWEAGPEWSLSQKNPNPTPDDTQGTSARVGQPDGIPGIDSFISTVVASDPGQTWLKFQTWYVSLNLKEARATIYGSDSPEGPWVEVWQPWSLTTSTKQWMQSPLLQTSLERGYPYYKIEFMCNYGGGVAGCKFTGVYFTTAADDSTVAAVNTPTVEPPSLVNETAETTGEGGQTAAGNTVELHATAVAPDEIELTWTTLGEQAEYTIQRSLNGQGGWTPIAVVNSMTSYSDAALEPDTEYFYRMRASVEGRQARSGTVSAETLALPAATESQIATPVSTQVALNVDSAPMFTPTAAPLADVAFERQPALRSLSPLYWFSGGIVLALIVTWLVIRMRRSMQK